MLKRLVLFLLSAAVLCLLFGCVNDENASDQANEPPAADNGEIPNGETPPDVQPPSGQEPLPPDGTVELPKDEFLIPDEEQFDQNGFPNPPEDEATKRY